MLAMRISELSRSLYLRGIAALLSPKNISSLCGHPYLAGDQQYSGVAVHSSLVEGTGPVAALDSMFHFPARIP